MKSRRAFSLLEVGLALFLLALAVWGMLSVYAGLLSGSREADRTQQVTAALETVIDATRVATRQRWVTLAPPDPELTYEGNFQEYIYEVTDFGRMKDPLDTSGSRFVEMRQVQVEMFFYQPDTTRSSKKVLFWVSR